MWKFSLEKGNTTSTQKREEKRRAAKCKCVLHKQKFKARRLDRGDRSCVCAYVCVMHKQAFSVRHRHQVERIFLFEPFCLKQAVGLWLVSENELVLVSSVFICHNLNHLRVKRRRIVYLEKQFDCLYSHVINQEEGRIDGRVHKSHWRMPNEVNHGKKNSRKILTVFLVYYCLNFFTKWEK